MFKNCILNLRHLCTCFFFLWTERESKVTSSNLKCFKATKFHQVLNILILNSLIHRHIVWLDKTHVYVMFVIGIFFCCSFFPMCYAYSIHPSLVTCGHSLAMIWSGYAVALLSPIDWLQSKKVIENLKLTYAWRKRYPLILLLVSICWFHSFGRHK